MLITQLKDRETIESLIRGKAFVINCHGCAEVSFLLGPWLCKLGGLCGLLALGPVRSGAGT